MDYRNATAASAPVPTEITLNERLNRAAERICEQSDRIEHVLSRVNGTPRSEGKRDVAQIRPTVALAEVVNILEAAQERLAQLANGVERIA